MKEGKQLEEGDNCPYVGDCDGTMQFERKDVCRCHVAPPCNACVSATLTCSKCGFDPEDNSQVVI